MSQEETVVKLSLKRRLPLSRLKEIYEYGINFTSEENYVQNFVSRAEYVQILHDEFSKYHNDIISLITTDKDYERQDRERLAADKYLYNIRTLKLRLDSQSALNASQSSSPKSKFRLPDLAVPCFNGDPKLWPSFHDIFNQVIHTNVDLPNVEKFRYLVTSLQGEPLNLIKNFMINEANYTIAYDKLVDKYQNRRFLATSYFNSIYFSPSLKSSNSKDLRQLLNTFSENLLALQALNFDTDAWDFVMLNILIHKLDEKSRTEFECTFSQNALPSYKELFEFLLKRCKGLENSALMTSNTSLNKTKPIPSPVNSSSRKTYGPSAYVTSYDQADKSKAPESCGNDCSEVHFIYNCPHFKNKTPKERLDFAKQRNLCINCLRHGHRVRECKSSRCRKCSGNHHSLLHFQTIRHNSSEPIASTSEITSVAPLQNLHIDIPSYSTVLLSTAVIDIRDNFGNFQKVRILLDTASMANLISEDCAQRLNLKRKHISVTVEGIDSLKTTANKGMCHCVIKPTTKSVPLIDFDAIVLPKICSYQPKMEVQCQNWSHIKNLELADPNFNIPSKIDLLLGAELFPYVIGEKKIIGSSGTPVALDTIFGWVLQGRTQINSHKNIVLSCSTSIDTSLDKLMENFWETEHVADHTSHLSPDEIKCDNIFKGSFSRDETGRFTVPLPFKVDNPYFGDSYSQALRRFKNLENRLDKNSELKSTYSLGISDYLQRNYITEVAPQVSSQNSFYLPHHGVTKLDGTSTKLRIVFDASAKASSGYSLNDMLYPGPKLQHDLGSILLRFRIYPIVFVCDIMHMYLQIFIRPEHRTFQKFLWRFNRNEDIKEYCINRVTFGVSSAPYLALRTLQELADQERENYPHAAKVLDESVYVDDCVCGADSLDSALQLQSELIKLLKSGGFELRKWASNDNCLLSHLPPNTVQTLLNFKEDIPQSIKVLGLKWDPTKDIFSYSIVKPDIICTKRAILSQIARLFDPLGFLAPMILFAKHLMQLLWISKCEWDETPSILIIQSWNEFCNELKEIAEINIPRYLFSHAQGKVELHGFCDASLIGYGCVIYFKHSYNDEISVKLICSKTKVAPLKTISIPRLELCGALLLANLIENTITTYSSRFKFETINAWCDSKVTLAWINGPPNRWKMFVANRVSKIQTTPGNIFWRYVPTEFNPADYASRGLLPRQLKLQQVWWNGPEFLYDANIISFEETSLPHPNIHLQINEEEKMQCLKVSLPISTLYNDLLNKFSSISKIQNIIAFVLRFCNHARNKITAESLLLSDNEREKALLSLIKSVQFDNFADIFACIDKKGVLSKPFRKLAVFVDADGVLRVGGRLKNTSLAYNLKHPILLPKECRLTTLIIQKFHQDHCHPGMKTLQNLIRQKFWIISHKTAIFRCISKCITCFKSRPISFSPMMADLPTFRLHQAKAFTYTALDYAGPIKITLGKYRGSKSSKAYICLFVCCNTKALHLELASDLTTEAFLACLRRFIARRGKVCQLYSDNGTNFIGAYNQLVDIAHHVNKTLSLNWRFSPPGSPHFNGLSEAGVKSVKTHLFRILGDQILTYEELYTLLTQIESMLNSRPLTALSDDPNDFLPLTPNHFLNLEPVSSFHELDHHPDHISNINRWHLLVKMHNDFWTRWSTEYLHTLHQRVKWDKSIPNIANNTLVLLKDENAPPRSWLLARIVQVHPGQDGIIRVATIKTKNGIFKRSVVKLCPLPIYN